MSPIKHWLQLTVFACLTILAGCTDSDDAANGPVLDNSINTPDTTGSSQAAAEQALRDAGLSIGTVTSESSDTVPEGIVIRTDPPAGNTITVGSTVNIIVSSGTATVSVPVLAGNTQAQAEAELIAAGLTVGQIETESSDTVPVGQVIRSIPDVSATVTRGASIDLVISTGPADVSVPNVVNLTEMTAGNDIVGAGLIVGTVTRSADDMVPAGSVILQTPVAGVMVSAGAEVDLVISLGPANIPVPDTVGLTEAMARTAITDAGLIVGSVTPQADVNVPAGDIISQDPAAATMVAAGSAVNLIVSLGPESVPVPDIVGLTQTEAVAVITNAGLEVGVITERFDNVVPAQEVISQSLTPGAEVLPDTVLDFVVSLGPPVATPNVVGLAQADAEAAIVAANLIVGTITEQNDVNVPAGNVISQDPTAATQVAEGTVVDLVVSLGPPMVAVPDVVGQTQTNAQNAITGVGLVVGTITQQASASVPAGSVISQSPTGGMQAIVGSAVNLTVSNGPPMVSVPDVVGQVQATGQSAITGAGLVVGAVNQQASNTVPSGSIISQNPAAGVTVNVGSAVDLFVSSGPASVSVPDVVGLTQAAGGNAITGVGLVVGGITQQASASVPSGSIISQNPTSGTSVTSGSAVDLIVSSGPATVTVPSVVGQSQAMAQTAITNAGLVVGTVTQQNDNTTPSGDVISQNPAGGSSVADGSNVDLVISLGPANVTTPNVVGQTQAQAEAAITGAALIVGTVTQQSDNTVPVGDVISQNPVAGTAVSSGSSVDLVVSSGPAANSFTDEFSNNSISDWTLRHQAEGTAAQYTVLDINTTNAGALTIVPTQTPGWFDGGDAPLVFKNITGNFSVYTYVLADSTASPGQSPSSNFNSAGLMARNPAGASGPENYIMLNIGTQNGSITNSTGSETKNTDTSNSNLFLDAGSNEGELILCRVGDQFHSFRRLTSDAAAWVALDSFTRNATEMPATLQVGMVVNAFNAPADLTATFEYIRLRPTPVNVSDCTP